MLHAASRLLSRGLPMFWLALGVAFAQTPPPNPAGTVVLVDGQATVAAPGGKPRPVKAGDVVSEGDTLASAKNGEVHLNMQDSGFVVLRPNTQMTIESYKADGGDDDKGVFRLLSGGLRSISGWIGKFNQRNYAVKTATATIGIRGTDHETWVIPEGSRDGEPGTYDRVYVGETVIQTPEGQTAVAPNQAGFQSSRARGKPRVLASIPQFYRPGPHEAEIAAKHAEIQKLIGERREERRKAIAQKRAELKGQREKVKETLEHNKEAAREGLAAAQQKQKELQARREELARDQQSFLENQKEIQAERKSIEEDWKGGRITRAQMRERRQLVNEKAKANTALEESIKTRRKAIQEESDALADQRFNATQERQKALREQVLDARGKRESLEQEKETSAKEIKDLQQQENQRYREELKKDRSGGDATGGAH